MAAGSESVSFFFPAYFDEKSLPALVQEFHSALEKTGRGFEIIIVDDCSPDETGRVADRLAAKWKEARAVHHEKNRGYGGALTTGFSEARNSLVGFTDGDAQYTAADLPLFLDAIGEADMVIGYRVKRADPVKRVLFQKAYKALLRLLFGLKFRDPDCSFKMMRSGVFQKVKPFSRSGFFSAEMLWRAKRKGLRVREVPVRHLERKYGKSTFFGWKRIWAMGKDMLRARIGKS